MSNVFMQPKPAKPKGANPSGIQSVEPDADDTDVKSSSDGDMDNVQQGKTKSLIKKYLMARTKKRKKS